MAVQFIWLLMSHGMLIAIGGALLEAGNTGWGLLFLLGTPALRIALRFRPGKGYYLIGYIGDVGGEMPTPSGVITHKRAPVRFRIMLGLELALIVFLWISVALRILAD